MHQSWESFMVDFDFFEILKNGDDFEFLAKFLAFFVGYFYFLEILIKLILKHFNQPKVKFIMQIISIKTLIK